MMKVHDPQKVQNTAFAVLKRISMIENGRFSVEGLYRGRV
jgi:hypothetical protein